MSEIKTIKKADNFTTVDFGKLNELSNYVLELGPDMRIPGKVFGGKAVNATGGEFPSNVFNPIQKPASSTLTKTMKNCISF